LSAEIEFGTRVSRLFPRRTPVDPDPDRESAILELDDENADEMFDVLSARTTRRVLSSLYEEPATASDLAERLETSIQNVQYHLGKLEDVDLVDESGTWYSERGNEMTVYTPSKESLVLVAGDDTATPSLVKALERLFGAISLVAVASLLIRFVSGGTTTDREGGGTSGEEAYLTTDAAGSTTTVHQQPSLVERALDLLGQPSVQLFLVGTLAALVLFALWYRVRYAPLRDGNGGRERCGGAR